MPKTLLALNQTLAALALAASALVAGPLKAEVSAPAMPAAAFDPPMPDIALIGAPVRKYFDIPGSAQGPAVDPAKGYRLESLGAGLYMITDGSYQSMFMVYARGVVVIDAPPSYAAKIPQAIGEVTEKPITHLIYSHSHIDHIGGAATLGGHPVIIAQEETKKLLLRASDPGRPVPTLTFRNRLRLQLGGQVLELSYPGPGHEPGNIEIYAPAQKTLMFVDIVFPGWMPWRAFGVAQDLPGYFQQVRDLDRHPFEKLVGGHVARIGTHADVKLQIAFDDDIKRAASEALATQQYGQGMNPADSRNPWALAADYTGRVARVCVATMARKWEHRIAAFDTFIWDQCYAMEQSLRVD